MQLFLKLVGAKNLDNLIYIWHSGWGREKTDNTLIIILERLLRAIVFNNRVNQPLLKDQTCLGKDFTDVPVAEVLIP